MGIDLRVNGLNRTTNYKIDTKYKSNTTTSGTNVSKDAFSISSEAQDFQTAMKAAKSTPDVREDKVEEIKNKFKNGSYEVNLSSIADKILA
ncbi:MAG: flagellar biosynthesis anti-sigma factor FlgM [Lachnospirales bacterium]